MPRQTKPSGPELLAAFLKLKGITYDAAAKGLHVSATTVWHWARGLKNPTRPRRMDIETWTRGEVPASSWPGEEEPVVPFAAPETPSADESGPQRALQHTDKTG